MSDAAASSTSGCSRQKVKSLRLRLAAGCFVGMRHKANQLLEAMCDRVVAAHGRCEVMYEIHRGDETPFAKMQLTTSVQERVVHGALGADPAIADDDGACHDEGHEDRQEPLVHTDIKCSPHLKVYQSDLVIGCLFTMPGGPVVLVTMELPMALQAYDSGTSEVSAASARLLMHPLKARLRFRRTQKVMTADGAPNIAKAERAMSWEDKESKAAPVETLRFWCKVHRIYKVMEYPLSMFNFYVSGIIRMALAMRGPGNFVKFVRIVRKWLVGNMEYHFSEVGPGAEADLHRKCVFDTFLPDDSEDLRSQRVRKFIIGSLANGDIRLRGCFQHFCRPGCCRNRQHAIEKLLSFFVPAVCGCLPPIWRRGRWTRNDRCIRWAGVLEAIHGMLSSCFRLWFAEVTGKPVPDLAANFESVGKHMATMLEDIAGDEIDQDSDENEGAEADGEAFI